MPKVQQWLESQEEYNTKEKREKVKELDISRKELEEDLDLSDFANLENLNCSYNQLTTVNLINCSQLKLLNCGSNKLTNLDLTKSRKLERISCNDNYLNSFDYSVLNPDKLISLN